MHKTAIASILLASSALSGQEAHVPNRLIDETSPYLLQHAHNPVDWYPWGPEAFEAARLRGVPIFLSIGYSTCYWCHVMERESFENEATAAMMNELFVCVKVDREERPDVDDIYMAATQTMTGSGGWPMSVFLDPETLKPFWCGTYFPTEPAQGRPSFSQVLRGMSDVWQNRRDEAIEQSEQLAEAVSRQLARSDQPVTVSQEHIGAAVSSLLQMFDRTEGGFGGAPKFPQPVYTEFLLDARESVDAETRTAIDHAVRHSLDRMAVGGLFDQAGGGFHRYCVDATWTVPHFEKMLYDNAQLVSVYSRAARLYDDDYYRLIVRRTLDYVLKEMTGEHGGFLSAQDAEVGGHEGLNYLWTPEQITETLNQADAAIALDVYGLNAGPNFRDPHHPEDGPKNVLRMHSRPDAQTGRAGFSLDAFMADMHRINAALYEKRSQREQPRLDDKVITAWNGMMIAAMVTGADALGDPAYLDAAQRAADFMLENIRKPDGLLHRSYRRGKSSNDGVLEDHAWEIIGLLALHDAGRGDSRYLDEAKKTAQSVITAFAGENGAYSDVIGGRNDLFVRARSTYDGAVPSGIGVMLHALLGLHAADPAGPWLDRAIHQTAAISREIAGRPVAVVNSARAALAIMGMGEQVAGRLVFDAQLTPDDPRQAGSSRAVEIFADAERVTVSDGAPAEFTLGFRIKPGFHILAADPVVQGADAAGLVPLRVGLVSGQGVAVYADYPEGEHYGAEITGKDELLVHTGELRLRVVLEKAEGVGAGPGEAVLGVTFQACDDSACLEPVTIRLGVEVVIE